MIKTENIKLNMVRTVGVLLALLITLTLLYLIIFSVHSEGVLEQIKQGSPWIADHLSMLAGISVVIVLVISLVTNPVLTWLYQVDTDALTLSSIIGIGAVLLIASVAFLVSIAWIGTVTFFGF